MTSTWRRSRIAAQSAVVVTAVVVALGVVNHATVITATPFTDTVDTTGASVAANDPATISTRVRSSLTPGSTLPDLPVDYEPIRSSLPAVPPHWAPNEISMPRRYHSNRRGGTQGWDTLPAPGVASLNSIYTGSDAVGIPGSASSWTSCVGHERVPHGLPSTLGPMGWCQAFGPQIQAGCDHSMVAGSKSCSCPECGVLCPGRFAGCGAVWAAGPRHVDMRRPTKELGMKPKPELARANGNRTHAVLTEKASSPAAVQENLRSEDTDGELRPLLEGLWADVRALRREVDELRQRSESAEQLAEASAQALSLVESLPPRIARAAGEAMRQQHQLNLNDFREHWNKFTTEADRITEARTRETAAVRNAADVHATAQLDHEHSVTEATATDPTVLMQEFDARFRWLVNEISERFVVLGNEMVRIEMGLVASGYRAPTDNGHTERPTASSLD